LREGEGRKAIKEAEGLHLGLLSSRDGHCLGWVKIGRVRVRVEVRLRLRLMLMLRLRARIG
jgi:hypothetical protein